MYGSRGILCVYAVLTAWWIPLTTLWPGEEGEAEPVGWSETFALSDDRARVLQELVPGTSDYYFFRALQLQATGDSAGLNVLLEDWRKRFPESQRRTEIENREAVILIDRDPGVGFAQLAQRIGLDFDHDGGDPSAVAKLATALDQNLISAEAVYAHLLKRMDGALDDISVHWLLHEGKVLTALQRRQMLTAVDRPDLPNLLNHIVAEQKSRSHSGFGEFSIHSQLLPEQLDELARRVPELRNDPRFVAIRIGKMRRSVDVGLMAQQEAHGDFLKRAWNYLDSLPPVHASLKLHVLHHLLALQHNAGSHDRGLFDAYLAIPRDRSYMHRSYLEDCGRLNQPNADTEFDGSSVTGLHSVGDDEALLRSYVLHFVASGDGWEPFTRYLSADWIKPIAAEGGLRSGRGDRERWASMLDASAYRSLRDRVDLELAPTNPQNFAPGKPVQLALILKNVPQLQIKVYEINAFNHCRDFDTNVDLDVALDGLAPSEEIVREYAEPPLREHRDTFSFPNLQDKRGVWVIDFIGNGKSSRALIRRGALDFIVQEQPGAMVFTIYNEDRKLVPDAELWMGERRFVADSNGEVAIPYPAQPGTRPVIVSDGHVARWVDHDFPAERYQFQIDCHLDHLSLVAGARATVLVRPRLYLNGRLASLNSLKKATLTITGQPYDDGVKVEETVADVSVPEHREIVHSFTVPPRLGMLSIEMRGQLEVASGFIDMPVVGTWELEVNGIDRKSVTAEAFLLRTMTGYSLEVRDKSGSLRPETPVTFQFFREVGRLEKIALRTDASGTIDLGVLDGLYRVTASIGGDSGSFFSWHIADHSSDRPMKVHAHVGQDIELPWFGTGSSTDRRELSLLEKCHGSFVHDWFSALSMDVDRGFLRITDLPRGDFQLTIPSEMGVEQVVRIAVASGTRLKGYAVSDRRVLELPRAAPVQVSAIDVIGENAVIGISNANPFTRVHVIASHFAPMLAPGFSAGRDSSVNGSSANRSSVVHVSAFDAWKPHNWSNSYASGRDLGDEYRYIYARQRTKKYPGNMLPRPGLLLTPWGVRNAPNGPAARAKSGTLHDGSAGADSDENSFAEGGGRIGGTRMIPWNVDFLASNSVSYANLKPDNMGRIEIPLDSLGGRGHLQVLAVDPEQSVSRVVALERRTQPVVRETRLTEERQLAIDQDLAQRHSITVLLPDQSLTLTTNDSAPFEGFGSVASVHHLLATLLDDKRLHSFRFLSGWISLPDVSKNRYYSKFACHELHVFLWRKDPAFFEAIVRPYLSNKLEKDFIDRFLLNENLSRYLEPWQYGQLNAAERALLVHRYPEQAKMLRRRVADALAAVPIDLAARERVFEAAIGASGFNPHEPEALSGIAQREIIRRQQRVADAEEAGFRGDAFATEGAWEQAVNEYRTALDMLPYADNTNAIRASIGVRNADASVELARQRAGNGEYDSARGLLNSVLAVNPDHAKAQTLLRRFDDPDRYPVALTPEHMKKVNEVERLLRLGVGYYDLGQYDKAREQFNAVLGIDRYNTAARSLLEKTDRTIMNHLRTARDQMRSDLLRQVNELWQVPVPNVSLVPDGASDNLGRGTDLSQSIIAKLRRIVIPSIQFERATIDEAITFMRIKTRQLDDLEPDPNRKGVNFIVKQQESAGAISLSLTNIPAIVALNAIADLAGMQMQIEPFAVVIAPTTDEASDIVTRVYDVAPDFLSMRGGSAGAESSDDPFAAEDASPSGRTSRSSSTEILAAAGIAFGDGASAFYNPATGQLVVRNTASQLDLVQAFTGSANTSGAQIKRTAEFSYFARQPEAAPILYQKLRKTEELAENQYYQVPPAQRGPALIGVNRFWMDYAEWNGEGLFLSPHFGEAASGLNEALLVLALLDLPFDSQEPVTALNEDRLSVTAMTPQIVFHREIAAIDSSPRPSPVLVSQKFYRADERHVYEGAQKRTKYVTDAFLTQVVYTTEIVLTNTGEARQTVGVLAQIPAGALTVKKSKETLTRRLSLDPFRTERSELHFYFPHAGRVPRISGERRAKWPTGCKVECVHL